MDSNFSSNPNKKGSDQHQSDLRSSLILHNDHVNTFDFVMHALEEVCMHTSLQAEQCAVLAHFRGKCEIMRGDPELLRERRADLTRRGLKVTIE